jgi:hypothetical protein
MLTLRTWAASGAVVAYYFPPQGLGCRCLTFIIYGICQTLICGISVVRNASEVNNGPSQAGWGVNALYVFLWSISLFTAVGGTTLQVVGVFRNCFCASLARFVRQPAHWFYTSQSHLMLLYSPIMHSIYFPISPYTLNFSVCFWSALHLEITDRNVLQWVDIYHKNPSINLATDTQQARNASEYWIVMGTLASVFVGSVTYIAYVLGEWKLLLEHISAVVLSRYSKRSNYWLLHYPGGDIRILSATCSQMQWGICIFKVALFLVMEAVSYQLAPRTL